MKKFLFFLVLIANNSLFARIGCRDDSWHMKKRYDYKEDHAVECYCDCQNTLGRCKECNHYHDPQPWIIIESHQENNKREEMVQFQSTTDILNKIITQYKAHKK